MSATPNTAAPTALQRHTTASAIAAVTNVMAIAIDAEGEGGCPASPNYSPVSPDYSPSSPNYRPLAAPTDLLDSPVFQPPAPTPPGRHRVFAQPARPFRKRTARPHPEPAEPGWEQKFECLDDASCVVCTDILLGKLARLGCGHVFHDKCFKLDEPHQIDAAFCPVCRAVCGLNDPSVLDEPSDLHAKIRKAPVKCPQSGCNWEGTLDQFVSTGHHEAHVDWRKEVAIHKRRIDQLDNVIESMAKEARKTSRALADLRRTLVIDVIDDLPVIEGEEGSDAARRDADECLADAFGLHGRTFMVAAFDESGSFKGIQVPSPEDPVQVLDQDMYFQTCRRLEDSIVVPNPDECFQHKGLCVFWVGE